MYKKTQQNIINKKKHKKSKTYKQNNNSRKIHKITHTHSLL